MRANDGPEDVNLRRAEPADSAGIRTVARESWPRAYEGIVPPDIQGQAIASWYSDHALTQCLADTEEVFLVAETPNRVAGFVHLGALQAGSVELLRIYVLPQFQRHGIGRQLLEEAISLLPSSEIGRVTVSVARQNTAGCAFYERSGFSKTGLRTIHVFGCAVEEATYERLLGRGIV